MKVVPPHLCLGDLLGEHARATPDRIAISAIGRSPLNYGRLYDHVLDVVQTLNRFGIGRNDRVAIVLPNGPELAVTFLAVASGATSAPLNPAYRADEFAFYLSDLNAKALIVQAGVDSPARAVAKAHGIRLIELESLAFAEAGLFKLGGDAVSPPDRSGLSESHETALVLHTSGTTSRPKIVPLKQANILASADSVQKTLKLSSNDRCLNLMPLFHVHGLIGAVLSSLAAGASIVCTPGFYATRFFEWLKEADSTWYTAVPTMHQAILARAGSHAEAIKSSKLRFIRSSSAAMPPKLMAGLEEVFHVPVIEAYGMTEAAHQMASNPLPPKQRKASSVGVATGPEIAIIDETGRPVPARETGEVVIRGNSVFEGYEDNPEANSAAFIDGWFRTGDQGFLDADGYLFITGRLKEIINRGGEKISPREIDEVLMDHPSVSQAVAFAIPHNTLGEDVAAAVVLHEKAVATETEIRQFAVTRLADFKVPNKLLILDEIPKGATGKLKRIGLAAALGLTGDKKATPPEAKSFVAPRTPLEERLALIWKEVLGVKEIGVHDNFFELGGDSILAAQLISRVRDAVHVELSFLNLFDMPTLEGTAETVQRLLGETTKPHAQSVNRVPRDRVLPLSYGQQQMWLFERLEPGTAINNRPVAYSLNGPVNVGALEQSLSEIVRRHESLRTVFTSVQGLPIQLITPAEPLSLTVIDVQGLPVAEREAVAYRIATQEARRPFDLAEDLFLRAQLLRLEKEKHVLLLNMHHIASDAWSTRILFKELSALYEAFSAGRSSRLPELPIQYGDYASWQRQYLTGEILEKQIAYWRQQLSGAPPTLDLPADRPRPARQSFRGAKHTIDLSPELSKKLALLSRAEGVTLFMTLLAAFQVLLSRCSGQEDVVVGCPTAGRGRIETEDLIGFFVNTLVIRTDLSANPRFRQLLQMVRQITLSAFAHQDLPFEKLVEELKPERSLSHMPLCQVFFALQSGPRATLKLSGLELRELNLERQTSGFDLSLYVAESRDGLALTFEYNTDLFDATTISRMACNFETLLTGVVSSPEERIGDLPLLSEVDRQQLLTEWTDHRIPSPYGCIHELFDEQVAKTPDAVALISADREVTFAKLKNSANQLAHYLQRQGVGPEVVVAVYMERSIEMIVTLLAILKAGGAFLAIDPSQPAQRTAFLIEDSRAHLVLTQESLADVLAPVAARTVSLDACRVEIASEDTTSPAADASPDNAAYIIYTSGSTGTPKGSLSPHYASINRFAWMWRTFPFAAGELCCQKTSYSFGDSIWETFGPLLRGVRILVIPDEISKDPHRLVATLSTREVTRLVLVPSLLQAFLKQENDLAQKLPRLKFWTSSGETLPTKIAELFKQCLPAAVLLNLYGSSELAADVTCHVVDGATKSRSISIGRAIDNNAAYVLDSGLQLVPIGVCGELYVAGDGLARAYIDQPALTGDKFLPNPFSDKAGSRMFRTGDLARYLEDGTIEFLGRRDFQVKLRGFRIEPGEIESLLCQHSSIRECVVMLREDIPDDRKLVAYIVPLDGIEIDQDELRAFVRKQLPDYMIPATFVELAALPLTTSGKVNRLALPPPQRLQPELGKNFVPPGTVLEQALAAIWCEVLHLEQVGINDNFFELGGHSLRATQVSSRVRDALQIELPMRSLFESPTVASLAARVENASLQETIPPAPHQNIPRMIRKS